MAVIGSGSSGRGGAPGGGTIIIRGTWKLTQEKNGLGERTNRTKKKKKERKAKERLPGAGVWRDPGRGTLAGLRGRLSLGALPFTWWERDPIGDPRRPTVELPVGLRVGAAQGHPANVERGEAKEEPEARASSRDPALRAALTGLPGQHPEVGWLGVGRVQSSPAERARRRTR